MLIYLSSLLKLNWYYQKRKKQLIGSIFTKKIIFEEKNVAPFNLIHLLGLYLLQRRGLGKEKRDKLTATLTNSLGRVIFSKQ